MSVSNAKKCEFLYKPICITKIWVVTGTLKPLKQFFFLLMWKIHTSPARNAYKSGEEMNMSYKAPETSVLQGPDNMCWHSPPWLLKDQVAGCRTNLKDWLKGGEIRVAQLCGHILDVFFPMENLIHVPKPIHWAYSQSIFMEPDEWLSLLLIKKCYSVLFLLTSNFHITLSFLISEIKKVVRERCSRPVCTLGLLHSNLRPMRNTWKGSLLPSRLLHWIPDVFPHKK